VVACTVLLGNSQCFAGEQCIAQLDADMCSSAQQAKSEWCWNTADGACAEICCPQLRRLYWRRRCRRGGGSARCVIVTQQGGPARLLRCVRRVSLSATAPKSAAHWMSSYYHMAQHRQLPLFLFALYEDIVGRLQWKAGSLLVAAAPGSGAQSGGASAAAPAAPAGSSAVDMQMFFPSAGQSSALMPVVMPVRCCCTAETTSN
jgi:hypothetical protein